MYKRGVPLDPDRDERQGWLGDPAKDAESDAHNFNVASFYAKWLVDIRMDQSNEGQLSSISPVAWPNYESDLVWPSVFTIVPDWLHAFDGDRRVLAENDDAMKRWLDFQCRTNQNKDFTVDRNCYGDWCDVSTIGVDGWGDKVKGITSKPLIATAYHYNNIRIMARTARLLGKPEDFRHYEALASQVGEAFTDNGCHDSRKYYGRSICAGQGRCRRDRIRPFDRFDKLTAGRSQGGQVRRASRRREVFAHGKRCCCV